MRYFSMINYILNRRRKILLLLSASLLGFALAQILSITIFPSTSISVAQMSPCSAIPRQLQAPDPKASAPLPPTVLDLSSPSPAPQIDRVEFPENYRNTFKLIYAVDRPDKKQVRVICGNDIAAAVQPGKVFPYGSIFVMEIYHAKQDANGNILKDEKGQYIGEALTGIFVQRKEKGFGADYLDDRSGEWEYMGYLPNKTYLPNAGPGQTNTCASCHLKQVGKSEDYVFRKD